MDVAPPELPRVRLVAAWARVTVFAWIIVMAGLIATAVTGRNVGKPAWWIGTETDPAFVLLWIAPFVLPVFTILLAFRASRLVPFAGIASAIVIAAFAVGDMQSSPGVALVGGIVAFGALLISLATFAGLERR